MSSLQNICKLAVRYTSSSAVLQTSKVSKTQKRPYENSAEYSSDGEKIYCDLQFTKEGSRTEEEIAMIVETARARAFEESLKNVAIIKVDP